MRRTQVASFVLAALCALPIGQAVAQPPHGTTAQPSKGTTAQPSQGTTAQPSQGTTAQDKAPIEMSAADTTKWLAFFDALVSAVVKGGKDCDKMAANINAVVDANKDTLEHTRVAQDQGKKLPQSAQQQVMDGIDKMVPGLQQCGDNEKVKAAFSRLDMNKKSTAARS